MGLVDLGSVFPVGDKAMKYRYFLTSEFKFDAAHRLSNYKGKCSQIHGHTYRVIITIGSFKLNHWGAVMDFGDLKKIFRNHIDQKYDHKTILWAKDKDNQTIASAMGKDWITWMDNNPTAENMARDIWNDLLPVFKQSALEGIELVQVTIYETATNAASYREETWKKK